MQSAPSEPVTIERQPGSRDGVQILKITGPLTIRNFFDFQEVSRRDTTPILIVDLGDVPFMDSAALGCLLGLHVSRERNHRKYAVVRVPERLQTLFSVCGVKEVLTTFATVEAAEAALAP